MNENRLPGFGADASLYRGGKCYQIDGYYHRIDMNIYPALVDNECYNLCYNNCLQKCFNLPGWDKRMCVADCRQISRECREACTVPPCVPTTICRQDPVTTDPHCQVCHRDNCDGTASMWYTC